MEFDRFVSFILGKIKTLREARGWTVYRLAEETGINAQTIHNWNNQGAVPTLRYLDDVCRAFGITMSEFFAKNDIVEVTPEVKRVYDMWCALPPEGKATLESLLVSMSAKK